MRKVVSFVVLSFVLLTLSLRLPFNTLCAEENTVVSTYSVSLPAEITLVNDGDSYTGSYTVGVKGSIKYYEMVEVIPSSSVNVIGKTTGTVATATINQEVTNWSNVAVTDGAVIGTDDYVTVNGCVAADLKQADEYEGEFEFSFKLSDRPGIYDVDGNLLRELVASDIKKDFSSSTNLPTYYGIDPNSVSTVIYPEDVTFTGIKAFDGCSNLKSVMLSKSITEVSNYSFRSCTSLDSVELNNGLKTIGVSAFYKCKALASIDLPTGLKTIQNTAFSYSGLTSIILPEGLKTVGNEVFKFSSSLSSVEFPSTLSTLGGSMFGFTAIKNIVIPNTITNLNSAFSQCDTLESIDLPDGLKFAGSFYSCSSLKELYLPDSVTKLTVNNNYDIYYGCASLEVVHLSESITEIPPRTFQSCTKLREVNIPDGVTSIGYNAFYYCSSLKSISIPDSVTSIGTSAFYNSGLTSMSLPDSITSLGTDVFSECKSLEYLKFPSGLTSIPSKVCYRCTNLTSVELPNQFTTIDKGAFRYCYKLQSFEFKEGLISIGDRAFDSCTILETPTFPSTLESFGEGAFAHCKAFTSLEIPEKVTVISSTCFADMGITSVVFRGSITSIEDRAFYQCVWLEDFPWQDSMKSVGSRAFYQCYKLITTVPDTVESIASDAFREVYSVHYYGSLEGAPWGATNVHLFKYGYCTVCSERVPGIYNYDGILVYTFGESDFTRTYDYTLERPITSITSITSASIRYVVIPEGVTSIPDYMFKGCGSIRFVDFPSSITTIGSRAFYLCGYANLKVPDTVTSIGEDAFYKAQSITYSGTAEGAPWGALSVNSVSTTSLEVQEVRKDWNSIVEDYPDKWVVLKDVVFNGEDIESAVVVSVETDGTIIEYQENHIDDNFVYRRTTESSESGIVSANFCISIV